MIRRPTHVGAFCVLIAPVWFAIAAPGWAQAPTDAQRSAIRSACRSDYMAHCSSVPPGGVESLQCLQKNMSSLSSSCQAAVRAIQPAEPPKAETAPKAETPAKTEAAPKAETPPKAEAAPTTEPAKPNNQTATQSPKATPAPAAKKPSNAGSNGKAATAVDAPPVAAPADKPATLVLRPMLPREELFVVRSACGPDVRALCQGVVAGGGRIVRCLAAQAASLSPACRGVLGQFAAQ
jgi:hypothetical protein